MDKGTEDESIKEDSSNTSEKPKKKPDIAMPNNQDKVKKLQNMLNNLK